MVAEQRNLSKAISRQNFLPQNNKFMEKSIKNLIKFSLAFFFLQFILTGFANAQTEKEIVKIRADVAAINKGAAKYRKKTKAVEDISLEGTEATYYAAGKSLKKITSKMYGETFNATGEFYYLDGQLIFAFLKHNRYDTQIGMDKPPKVVSVEERRFYFAGGDLIRLLVGKKELKSGDERYDELRDGILDTASKLKNSYEN